MDERKSLGPAPCTLFLLAPITPPTAAMAAMALTAWTPGANPMWTPSSKGLH